jgi:His-Xaa-Ser system protein HxsD
MIMTSEKTKKKINIEFDEKRGVVSININPKIYPLPIIFQACDVFIDRAYVFLDGDPEKRVEVIMKPKGKCNLEELSGEFNNELLNYAAYFVRSQVNRDTREAMLKRAFLTVDRETDVDKKFEEIKAKKQRIDIGTKGPLVNDPIEANPTESDAENPGGEDFWGDDVFKKWEDQKGAIRDSDVED